MPLNISYSSKKLTSGEMEHSSTSEVYVRNLVYLTSQLLITKISVSYAEHKNVASQKLLAKI